MEILVLQTFNAVSVGSILLLISMGLAFTFGLMNVINMAHGEFIMIGAYVTYILQILFTRYVAPENAGLYFVGAIPLSFLIAGLIGLLLERTLVRFLYQRPLDTLLATWGVSMVLQQVARDIFGAPNVQVVSPGWLNGAVRFAGVLLPYKRLFIIGLVTLCVAAVYFYLSRSASGRRTRAVMQNRAVAACMGISTGKVDAYTFALGSGLAGVAGSALTLLGPVGPSIGTYYIVDAFMVVVLGGVGQLWGTIAAAATIGGLNAVFEFGTTASTGKALVLAAVILFLQWRPSGFLRVTTRSLD